MSICEPLDNSNLVIYAARHYDNISCFDDDEFFSDLNRYKYVKRGLNKYLEKNDLQERLILNHIVTMYNLFGPAATTRILFLKLEKYLPQLIPFLDLLGYLPEVVEIGNPSRKISIPDIVPDAGIQDRLRRI